MFTGFPTNSVSARVAIEMRAPPQGRVRQPDAGPTRAVYESEAVRFGAIAQRAIEHS